MLKILEIPRFAFGKDYKVLTVVDSRNVDDESALLPIYCRLITRTRTRTSVRIRISISIISEYYLNSY